MRGNMLTAGLVACGLATLSPGSVIASARPPLVRSDEQPGAQSSSGEAEFRDELMEQPTIPLGPYWMAPWPPVFCGALVQDRGLEKSGP